MTISYRHLPGWHIVLYRFPNFKQLHPEYTGIRVFSLELGDTLSPQPSMLSAHDNVLSFVFCVEAIELRPFALTPTVQLMIPRFYLC